MKVDWAPKHGYYGILTLYVDEEPWRDVHHSIFGRKPALPRHLATLEELSEWFQKEERRLVSQYVLKRITIKSYHSVELSRNLAERLVSEHNAKQVIREFQTLGYINDHDWLESFVKGQMTKKFGPRAILMKIRSKGIPTEDAAQFISRFDDAESRLERLISLISTRYRSRQLADFQDRQKTIAALVRKGFQVEEIRKAIKKIISTE